MHHLEQATLQIIRRHGLLGGCSSFVAGISGGADSTALLLVLAALRQALAFSLRAVYVDHGLRPLAAPGEAAHVQDLALRLGVPFHACRVDARQEAAERKISLEHACRDLRYQKLFRIADALGGGCVAVAHTADDQVETILLRLLRGGGGRALSGMRVKQGRVIRPFLEFPKEDLLRYLRDRQAPFCEDASNQDRRFLRNRVRHELLPFLQQHCDPGVRGSLLKSSANLAEDEALLDDLTEQAMHDTVELDPEGRSGALLRSPFCLLAPALQRRVAEKLLCRLAGQACQAHILSLMEAAKMGRNGSELHFNRGLRVLIGRGRLDLFYPQGRMAWRGNLGSVKETARTEESP